MKSILLYFFVSFMLECANAGDCDTGWTKFHDSCYQFNVQKKTWAEAEVHCMLEGGQLAEIETEVEDYFLRTQLLSIYGGKHRFWIGGTDAHTEGRWVWGKSGRFIEYAGWAPKEPNDWHHSDEDCMDMDGISISYAWNDESCSFLQESICEKYTGLNPV